MGLKSSTQKKKEKKRIGNICGQHDIKNSKNNKIQRRRDLLNAFQDTRSLWSGTPLLPPFFPKTGLSNFFSTLLNPDPRRPRRTSAPTAGGWGRGANDRAAPGSDRLRPSIARVSCNSNDSLSNWSNSVLCSSPNFPTTAAISSILFISTIKLQSHSHQTPSDGFTKYLLDGQRYMNVEQFALYFYMLTAAGCIYLTVLGNWKYSNIGLFECFPRIILIRVSITTLNPMARIPWAKPGQTLYSFLHHTSYVLFLQASSTQKHYRL